MRSRSIERLLGLGLCLLVARSANAQSIVRIDYARVLELARTASPDVASARAREVVARDAIGIAGTYPNPTFSVGTSSQTALLAASVSVPLVVFGQLGKARSAARADLATVKIETEIAWNDVRAQTAHAFVALWLAQQIAEERATAETIQRSLDASVRARVDVGNAPEIDALRTHADELRGRAEARASTQLVDAASAALERWIGSPSEGTWRAAGEPFTQGLPSSLVELTARASDNPAVRRERADENAALARASHERSLVAPLMAIEFGADFWDPTLPATNFRGLLTFDLPLFNHRGSYVEREKDAAVAAGARADAERFKARADLGAAYARFEAARTRATALANDVVPASEAAAKAIEEAYTLGRAPLVTVLEAERVRIDTRLAAQQARAEQADAWIDVEHIAGIR